MKKNIALVTVAVIAVGFLIVGIVGLTAYLNRGTVPSESASAETESAVDPTEYQPPAKTPATWSAFDTDTTWSVTDTFVRFKGETAEIRGSGASLSGGILSVRAGGNYVLSGSFDGQIYIEVPKTDKVHLIFNGLTVNCAQRSPVLCEEADKLVITLVSGTENTVNDTGSDYVDGIAPTDGRFAGAIHSKVGLTVNGNGALTVNTTYRHGIVSNSNLRIVSGTLSVTAQEEGLKGKRSLSVRGGHITVESGGDGLKVSDGTEENSGFLAIEGGELTVRTDADGLDAVSLIRIVGGTLRINSKDHGMTTEGEVSVAGTPVIELDAYSGDETSDAKGIKADGNIAVESGTVRITRSFEGIESKNGTVCISGGDLEIVSENDGVNAKTLLRIEGGSLFVRSSGDGLDSGGDLILSGGTVVICGSPSNEYSPLDVPDGYEIRVSGGFLLAYGSVGTVQYPAGSSAQKSLCTAVSLHSGTVYALRDAAGNTVCTFEPLSDAESLCISSPLLESGAVYTLYSDVQTDGTKVNGVYTPADSRGGEVLQTCAVS